MSPDSTPPINNLFRSKKSPFKLGYDAARRDIPATACPYASNNPVCAQYRAAWQAGHDQYHKEQTILAQLYPGGMRPERRKITNVRVHATTYRVDRNYKGERIRRFS